MAEFAKADVSIVFDHQTPTEFLEAQCITNALKEFHGSPCVIDIIDNVSFNATHVDFEMVSDAKDNLEFQIKLLAKYIIAKGYKVVEFNTTAWQYYTPACFNFETEDFEDYFGNSK